MHPTMALADMRKDNRLTGLAEGDLAPDPFRQFERWFAEAGAAGIPEPNAMVLSAVGRDGRPRASQLAAWASPQSSVIAGRALLEKGARAMGKKLAGREAPRPPNWGGFRLEPETGEFWQGRRNRLHDRLRFRREAGGGDWIVERLAS